MTTALLWYFLATAGRLHGIETVGPFASEAQCNEMMQWASQYNYASACYAVPHGRAK